MKNRFIRAHLVEASKSRMARILLVTGARQTGKTTLIKELFPDFSYISFDDPLVRSQFASLSAEDLALRFPKAILDEVQKMPSMFDTVKAAHDAHGECRFVLSGSSQVLLMEHIAETLAGRVSIFEMSPLSLPECRTSSWSDSIAMSRWMRLLQTPTDAKDILFGIPAMERSFSEAAACWDRYLAFGGMPILWNDELSLSSEERRRWLTDYARTYLQRDIRDLVALKDLEPFILAQRSLALQTGGILSIANIARDAMIAPSTASRFIQYLERSYQILILRPWFSNPKKRLVKSPKMHFADPGVLRAVAGFEGTLPGNAFESATVTELVKQLHFILPEGKEFYLRTADGLEVDLLVETAQGYIAVEIKQSTGVSRYDARHLLRLDSILDKPVLCRLVVSQHQNIAILGENTYGVPMAWLLG